MACESYYFGECTRGACEYAYWVPEGLGNAGDWAGNAAARGFAVTMTPTVGAVVVYGAGNGYSSFGHCGVVLDVGAGQQFLVHEMNYVAWDQYDDRWSNLYDVVGFILPPGVSPGAGAPSGLGPGPGPQDRLALAWATLAADWNTTLPDEVAGLAGDIAALENM